MRTRNLSIAVSLALGFLVVAAVMTFLADQPPHASPGQDEVITVCLEGVCDYDSLQEAVDAANNGDLIKVAAGTYSGVQGRPAPDGYPHATVVTQVLYLDKSLTIQGGYAVGDWVAPDPAVNVTRLDAEGRGRALVVARPSPGTIITPALAGLHIAGGDAAGLRGHPGYPDTDAGGGVYVFSATVIISDSRVSSNIAHWGGGLYLFRSPVTLYGNAVFSNTARETSNGGGLYLHQSAAVLEANTVSSNHAGLAGGGLFVDRSPATLVRNVVASNTAESYGGGLRLDYSTGAKLRDNVVRGNEGQFGGGLYLKYSDVELSGNSVAANTANGSFGGGLYLERSAAVISRNLVVSNTAALYGGGLHIYRTPFVTLTNNVVADNQADLRGSGIYIWYSGPGLLHNTIARNRGGDGSGIYVENPAGPEWADPLAVALTNSIIVGHRVGISVAAGGDVVLDGVLWDSATITRVSRSPLNTSVVVEHELEGDPTFAPDGYHLLSESDAIDEGVPSGVDVDIDLEPRPRGAAYDLGADEHGPILFAGFEHSAPHWFGQETVFTNTTIVSGPVSYRWSFGDGASSTAIDPRHTYTAPGKYNVVLTATSGDLQDTASRRVEIHGVSFTSSSPDWLGQSTAFTNTSEAGVGADYAWAFGDGAISTQEHPTHTYGSPGWYSVTLTVTNDAGSGVGAGSVAVYGPPEVDFVAWPREGISPLSVSFTALVSTTPPGDPSLRYLWHFAVGDPADGTSTLPNPRHTYVSTGVYTVSLRVTNTLTSAVAVKPLYIRVRDTMDLFLPLITRGG